MVNNTRITPIVRNRLPNLMEVLRRSTRPPVDLYCYYLFLQREGSEDTLDFWLDVQQHENLCRAFFKDLRKSGRLVKDDWPRYHEYARTRGSIYGAVTGVQRGDDGGEHYGGGGGGYDDEYRRHSQDASGSTTGLNEKYGEYHNEKDGGQDREQPSPNSQQHALPPSHQNEFGRLTPGDQSSRYDQRTPSPSAGGRQSRPSYPLTPTLKSIYPHDEDNNSSPGSNSNSNTKGTRGGGSSRANNNRKSTNQPTQPFIPRDVAINRTDLIASAERIYSRYLMPGADKEVYLPSTLRIQEFPLSSSTLPAMTHPDYDHEADAQARIPDMFHGQKEYVYRAMELDTFPRFLRAKAFGNLTPMGGMVRLGFGLISLWIGLTTALAFIFLDTKPKVRRLWIILPFTVAIINLVAHGYDLDPILVFMGLSETTPFRTIGIREPYVRRLLFGRALWVTLLTAIIVAILTLIFYFVPGHRL